jgi:pimeloyl-ACP methyl ester carboxylesterase
MTIGEMSTPLESYAKTHKMIAAELQGHGPTADSDRPFSFETMGDDIAALLNHLNFSKATLLLLWLGAWLVVTSARIGDSANGHFDAKTCLAIALKATAW